MPSGRVLFVTSSYPRRPGDHSGAFVHRLAVDLGALGWSVAVLAPHAPGLAADEELEGVAVHRVRYAWPEGAEALAYGGGMLANLREKPWTVATVPGLLAAERLAARRAVATSDVVHAHWVVPQGLALAGLRAPLVLSVHGSDVNALRGRAAGALQRAVLRRAGAVTANSAATAARVRELAGVDAHVVPMGVDLDPPVDTATVAGLRTFAGDRALVVVVARLVPQKGVDDLVRALAAVPGVALAVVGDGPDRATLEALARSLDVPARFVGAVDPTAVASYLAAADVVVSPSRAAEGQGLAVVEAMALGRPVVATAAGGQAESLTDGVDGLVVPPGDVAALADAVGALAADPGRREVLGRAARAVAAARFSRQQSAAAFAELYRGLLA